MKQPNLKARLISSVLVLVMLFTSLLGTTFAWFTDLAVSGGNTIQVGSLKVDLSHKVDGKWKSIKDNSNHKIFDYDKWEPGYTRFETLKIANCGNLALQYKLSIEVAGRAVTGSNGENLADVIDVYVVDGENTSSSSWTYKGTLTQVMRNPSSFIGGQLLPENEVLDSNAPSSVAVGERIVSIALRMQTTAGNAYQGLDVGDIYVNLVATQWNYEKDSFDNPDYDKDSTFPELNIGGITVDVNTNYNNVVTNTVSVSGEGVEATIPAGVEVDNGVNKLTLSVTEKENSDANLTLNDGEALRSLDVHISGVSKDNEKPMLITVEKAMKVGLNMGNYTLYHVENGVSNAMTAVDSLAELDAHNEFYYDPATGNVTLAMATFSEVAFVAETDPVWEGKVATAFAGGSGTEEDPYLIANADQLAYLGDLISNDNANYGAKYYKLVADINLGGEENANKGIIFYPIGYHKVGGAVAGVALDDEPESIYHEEDSDYVKNIIKVLSEGVSTNWYTYGGAFKGVFDGNGNTISNIYQNTWQMKGNYDGNYWNSAMGVFGYVYGGTVKNLTVDNFSSDGEFTPTGVIAAYAAGKSTFENIAITNCNPRVYNTGNGGIIGIAGSTTNAKDDHITLKNITVDNTNKISALWGSWDVACGGLVGMYRGNVDGSGNATGDTISFENCHVSAQIDVYNDVCANYQYYAYRYSGMIIGSVRHNKTNSDGRTVPNMAGISASGCTVNYGDWNDYYYCEFEKNSMASYSEDYQFSRVPHSELNFTDSNGNGVVDADERSSVTGCKHNHTAAENHQAVYLPFYQLFTGYSWGVSSIGLKEYSGIVTNLGISEGNQQGSVKKFEGKVDALVNYTTYKLSDIFNLIDNVTLVDSAITVTVTNKAENNPVSATIVYNSANWEDTTIKFIGVGEITISIQDYFFCTPTAIIVNVTEHAHEYDNDCDTTCNMYIRGESYNTDKNYLVQNEYKMVIIGFGDSYLCDDVSNAFGATDCLRDYMENGNSVMFSHDNMNVVATTNTFNITKDGKNASSINTDDYKFESGKKVPGEKFCLDLTVHLRAATGMDRYGITLTEAERMQKEIPTYAEGKQPAYTTMSSDGKYYVEELQGFSDFTLWRSGYISSYQNKASNSGVYIIRPYAYGLNGVNSGSTGYLTNGTECMWTTGSVQKVNTGQVTMFPYKLNDTLSIAATHGQYYQLDMEDKELVVWYTLAASSGYYKDTERDGQNNYYIYSKGNVSYTGAGHSSINTNDEAKLFINTIIKTIDAGNSKPKVNVTNGAVGTGGIYNVYATVGERYEVIFKAIDQDLATLETADNDINYVGVFEKGRVIWDQNGNGVYDEGVDIILDQYARNGVKLYNDYSYTIDVKHHPQLQGTGIQGIIESQIATTGTYFIIEAEDMYGEVGTARVCLTTRDLFRID